MNLLLTSGGLRNDELRRAFAGLLPKPADQVMVAVITTASKHELDKQFVEKDIADLKMTGIIKTDVLDISELPLDDIIRRLNAVDVIFVCGGDVYFLRDSAVQSGLASHLPQLLDTKLYVGISAGSRLLNPDISVAALRYDPAKDPEGLGLTDFCIVPHMNSEHFKDRTPELVKPKLVDSPYTTYLIDDNTAILIQGSMMQFVGGGEHKEFRND